MFNLKNKLVPTPPHNNDLKYNCHAELVSSSQNLRNPNGQTLTPALSRRRGGFTLAEVLITLVIIGVIAAITVPSLINKTNNQEYVSRLKKAYSTLAQATNQIIAEEGPVQGWSTSNDNIYNLYKNKLINAKECNTSSGCFVNDNIKFLNNDNSGNIDTSGYYKRLVLSDGIQVAFWRSNSWNCDYSDNGSRDICAIFRIDINGSKKPNTWGKDIFQFVLKEKGLYPGGCDSNNITTTCTGTRGVGCACRVIREGAINY